MRDLFKMFVRIYRYIFSESSARQIEKNLSPFIIGHRKFVTGNYRINIL